MISSCFIRHCIAVHDHIFGLVAS